MSSTLTWRPVIDHSGSLPSELKYALRTRFGDPVNAIIYADTLDMGFIEGLAASEVSGARDLLDAIKSHGSVILEEAQ